MALSTNFNGEINLYDGFKDRTLIAIRALESVRDLAELTRDWKDENALIRVMVIASGNFLDALGIHIVQGTYLPHLYIYFRSVKDDMSLSYDTHLRERYLECDTKSELLLLTLMMDMACSRYAIKTEKENLTVEFRIPQYVNTVFNISFQRIDNANAVRIHIRSEAYKHIPFLQIENEPECCVCYQKEKPISIKCGDVSHNICFDCLGKIEKKKCPMCRTPFGFDQLVRHSLTHDEKKKKRKNTKQREKKQ
jgi:hypothetical protein